MEIQCFISPILKRPKLAKNEKESGDQKKKKKKEEEKTDG